jgi:hypothetical protein
VPLIEIDETTHKYEEELRLQFRAPPSVGADPLVHVVFSGSVQTSFEGGDDNEDRTISLAMLAGPSFGDIVQVVPHVSIGRFINTNADEDNQQGFEINNLHWQPVFVSGTSEKRIQLRFNLNIRGEKSWVERLTYYVTASGPQLGQKDLAG